MATSQIETVSTGADKAKLAAAVVLAVGAIVAFYLLSRQGSLVQWAALLVGLAAAVGAFGSFGEWPSVVGPLAATRGARSRRSSGRPARKRCR
jgi:hypothetical protein